MIVPVGTERIPPELADSDLVTSCRASRDMLPQRADRVGSRLDGSKRHERVGPRSIADQVIQVYAPHTQQVFLEWTHVGVWYGGMYACIFLLGWGRWRAGQKAIARWDAHILIVTCGQNGVGVACTFTSCLLYTQCAIHS
jgi:hypothetical protein